LVAVVLAAAIGLPETNREEVNVQVFDAAGNSIGRADVPGVK
jgi:hypothetical protein